MTPEKYLCQWTFQFTLRCTQNLPGDHIQDIKGYKKTVLQMDNQLTHKAKFNLWGYDGRKQLKTSKILLVIGQHCFPEQ